LTRVLDSDATQGLPQIDAGATWPHIITAMPRANKCCEPTSQFESFLERKRHVDPQERFTSDRYRHHAALMDQA
jgi:hypothetical protein